MAWRGRQGDGVEWRGGVVVSRGCLGCRRGQSRQSGAIGGYADRRGRVDRASVRTGAQAGGKDSTRGSEASMTARQRDGLTFCTKHHHRRRCWTRRAMERHTSYYCSLLLTAPLRCTRTARCNLPPPHYAGEGALIVPPRWTPRVTCSRRVEANRLAQCSSQLCALAAHSARLQRGEHLELASPPDTPSSILAHRLRTALSTSRP